MTTQAPKQVLSVHVVVVPVGFCISATRKPSIDSFYCGFVHLIIDLRVWRPDHPGGGGSAEASRGACAQDHVPSFDSAGGEEVYPGG